MKQIEEYFESIKGNEGGKNWERKINSLRKSRPPSFSCGFIT